MRDEQASSELELALQEARQRLAELEGRMAVIETRTATATPSPPPGEADELGGDRPDRRQLLVRAGAVAAGALVGGAVGAVGLARPAGAAIAESGNPAVQGSANPTSGVGVRGITSTGTAVLATARATGTALVCESGRTHLRLVAGPAPPPTTTDAHQFGDVVHDGFGELWFCIISGSPGVWRKLSGLHHAGSLFLPLQQRRVYDSRPGFPPAVGVKAPLVGGVERSIDLKANLSGVPAGATAAVVNVVATGTTGAAGGFLAVYPTGMAWPGTSNLNWSGPGQNVAVTTFTQLSSAGFVSLYANVATDVAVDVFAFYQ
ncbi:MAG: hypothetical protein MUF83_19205 [Acidimicrobiales bacterium]|jgi:hypothetical protein|nr:hypothetical protein [Acidimicrobiales bacterium]